jgi:hypothetical protein
MGAFLRQPWIWVAVLVMSIAAWIDGGRFHDGQGSDSLIPVLVSLQHWTPFFWEQDRFGMLVPLVAMPFHHPLTNLLVQDWLMCVAALLAPFLVARTVTRNASAWSFAGALANTLFFVSARPEVRFDWLVMQPYALSISLSAGALIAAERRGPAWTAAACAVMGLAHWVNSGVTLLLVPLVLARNHDVVRSLIVIAAGAAAGTLAIPLSPFRTPTNLIPITDWPAAWLQLAGTTPTPLLYPALLGPLALAGAAGAAALLMRRDGRPALKPAAALFIAAATYWLAIATSRWVQMNLYYPRYVYPSMLLCGVAWSLVAALLLRDHAARATALVVMVLVAFTVASYGIPSLRRVRSILDDRFGAMTPDVITSGATVIGGDYWTVWPAVFHANLTTYREAVRRPPIYGLTFRSSATDGLWRSNAALVAVRTGDRALDEFATRTGVSLTFVDHRATIDLFDARPERRVSNAFRRTCHLRAFMKSVGHDGSRPFLPEEVLHQLPALGFAHAAHHVEPMIVSGQFTAADRRSDRARPWLLGAEHERTDPRVNERADAHEARLDRHAQRRAGEPIVAGAPGRLSDRDDLGVRRRIARRDRLIESAPDDGAVNRDDGADGHLARIARTSRLVERRGHQLVVLHRAPTTIHVEPAESTAISPVIRSLT